MSLTGSEKNIRVIREPGERELPRQKAKNQAKMFQFMKTKKKCSLRPPAVANAFHSGHSAEQNGRPYLIN